MTAGPERAAAWLLALWAGLAQAGPQLGASWSLCTTTPPSTPAPEPPRPGAPVQIEAERVLLTAGDSARFSGEVLIRRQDQRLRADRASYDLRADRVEARGDVEYAMPGLAVIAEHARMRLEGRRGRLDAAEYWLEARHGSGRAETVRMDGPETRLARVTYTTCDPDDVDWELSARRLTLHHDRGVGEARGVVTRFKGVPLFYSPYLSFPLDDRRKSGFLVPSVGRSDDSGTDVSVPYYLNLAPEYDATLTPRYLSERGAMLGAELRYLTPGGRGQLYGEGLPDDDLFGEDRGYARLEHDERFGARWRASVRAEDVSDTSYFDDLGGSLDAVSRTHLPRRASLAYAGPAVSAHTRVDAYQTIDPTLSPRQHPYERLPRVALDVHPRARWLGLEASLETEAVSFEHDVKVDGARLDAYPRLALPLGAPGYFVTPAAGLRYTAYELNGAAPGADTTPTRTVPITSLDTGLVFERDTRWGETALIQTLEPRLFYLYVPFRAQDDLILDADGTPAVFDTGRLDLNLTSLFRENRFSGPDRIGDADQLTTALTSRVLERDSGREWLRASLGQIHYFRDREVTLPGEPTGTDARSPLVADLALTPTEAWMLHGGLRWDPVEEVTEVGSVRIQYRPRGDKIVNLAYRQRRGVLEQTDLSFVWPLTRRWHAVGRWSYSLREDLTLEGLGGLEYESCCWALRLVGRRYVNDQADGAEAAIMLQLELKGLTSIGETVGRLLERDILGYRR